MKYNIFFVILLAVCISSCSTTKKNQGLVNAIPFQFSGAYEGDVVINGETMKVTLRDVDTERLSSFKNVKPLTGGNRILIHFDTDMEIDGAEYGALIYSDEVTFRRDDGGGWYNQELAVMNYFKKNGSISFDIPLKYFGYKPFRAWTEKTN